MARPRKNPDEQRSASIRSDLTLAEKIYVQQQAETAGLSEAEYTRRRVLGYSISPAPQKADAAVLSELNRIGVNLNQLARSVNAEREYRGDWQALQEELSRVLRKVAEAYDR